MPKDGPIDSRKLQGFKYFQLLDGLLERLRPAATERDIARNRRFFLDQYAALMILYYFNPTVSTPSRLHCLTGRTSARSART